MPAKKINFAHQAARLFVKGLVEEKILSKEQAQFLEELGDEELVKYLKESVDKILQRRYS
jgi:hypothetical protein